MAAIRKSRPANKGAALWQFEIFTIPFIEYFILLFYYK